MTQDIAAQNLADRVMVLRDEVLETAEAGDADPPGTEVFDAVVRGVAADGAMTPSLDLALQDGILRRLAWGEREDVVLASVDQVSRRLLGACQRAFRDPAEEMAVIEVATEVVCAAARLISQAAVSRAARERAAFLREELTQRRLRDAMERQNEDLARLQKQGQGG